MKIYHGSTSPNAIEKCRRIAPSYEHGYTWEPGYGISRHFDGWFGDNGAYSAFQRGGEWDANAWLSFLDTAYEYIADEQIPEPDFVVLPDVVGDAEKTYQRTEKWHAEVPDEWTQYFAVQDGMNAERACRFAQDFGCDGVFIGGTMEWKQTCAEEVVREAHQRDMKAHVARPKLPRRHEVTKGKMGFRWVERIGADSCDTTSVVRTGGSAYRHLRRLEQQSNLAEVSD
jgi:hypothetical protein